MGLKHVYIQNVPAFRFSENLPCSKLEISSCQKTKHREITVLAFKMGRIEDHAFLEAFTVFKKIFSLQISAIVIGTKLIFVS